MFFETKIVEEWQIVVSFFGRCLDSPQVVIISDGKNNLVCYYYDFSENECLNSKPKMIIFWLSMQVLTSLSLYKLPGIQWSHEVHLTWKANCVPHYRNIPDMKFIGDGQINHKNFIAQKAIYEIMVNKIKYSGSML